MKRKILRQFLFLVCSLFLGASFAFADGVMIVSPPSLPHIVPPPTPLSVKYHRVKVNIDNQVATTSIDQVFKNNYDQDLEGTYIFPLPDEATISDFALYMNGQRVSGEVLEKDKARQIYEDIVRKMKDPGLLEYVGRNMFKARVYPIPKHGETRIELVYHQPLVYDIGVCKYIYPLNTEKFSPMPLEEVAISVKINSKLPIKSCYSPSHEVDTKIDQYTAGCGYEAKNVKPDKDFVLYYSVSEKDVGLSLLCHRQPGGDGYFMMLLSPGQLPERTINKDIVFALDTSGSMSGQKIQQAREALRYCINSLGRGDRFNIISFATEVNSFQEGLVEANKTNIKEALSFVSKISARGGTNINDALLLSLKMVAVTGKPRMIVFLTDGEPTVGVTEMKEILQNINRSNSSKARLFVFGVGDDVNTHLLDKIAEAHRGVSEYVAPQENIEVKVSAFYNKISEPVLADISLNFGKIKVKEMYPLTLPDIFKGTQLVLLGRYEGDGATAITLAGQVEGKEQRFVYEDRFLAEKADNDFIPRIWATRKIGFLTSEIRLKGENKELIEEIVRLSKEYGIMTPYTSFLVLEEGRGRDDYEQWGIRHSAAPIIREKGLKYQAAMDSRVGGEAVSKAKDISELKRSEIAIAPTLETVKHIGDKTFYLRNGVWEDAHYQEGIKIQEIKYLSKEYFDLLRQTPKLGKYFAIGTKVMVVFEGKCYRISD